MDTERLWMEVALRDLTAPGKQAIIQAVNEIKAGVAEAEKAAGPSAASLANAEKFGKAIGDIAKTAAGVFTGIKLADATKDFAAFHDKTMANVAGLAPLAERLKVTTDELQAMQGAARRANVTNEELNKTVFTFNKNVGDAAQGNKVAIETFDKLGIKILDSHGQLRPMPDLLMETSRALMAVENGSLRASIGANLLGEKGARLNPLLRELAVPIGDLVERGKSFGEIVDRDVVEKLDKAKNSSEAASQQFTALYATVGDGTAYLAAETRRLNEALDTGRLTYEAYSAAMKDASEKADDLARKNRGALGGVDGVLAGVEQAAADWKRANGEFETGKRLMNDGFNLLKQAGNDWATTGVLDINKFGQAMLQMVANIGIALAQSELMKLFGLGGNGSGAGGGILNLFGGGGGGTSPGLFDGIMDMFNFFPTFAEGGDYQAGVPRITGEKGWELDIPNHSGTILNQRQLANLLGGGSERRSASMVERLGLEVSVSLDNDLLRAVVRDESGAVVATATPGIVKESVRQSGDRVVPIYNRHQAERGGDFRVG